MVSRGGTGGVSAAEIEAFAKIAGLPQDAGTTLDTRFCIDVAKLVAARLAKGECGAFSAFVRSEDIYADEARLDCATVTMLQHANDAISGHAWVATVGMRSSLRLAVDTSSEAFLRRGLEGFDLGTRPTVVVDWRGSTPIGRLFRNGISNHADAYKVSFQMAPVTEEDLKADLDEFYETTLRTPSATVKANGTKIWGEGSGRAAKGIPAYLPEERIQGRLVDRLQGSYPHLIWRAETPTEDGRADVLALRRVEADGRPATITDWILELKALADKTHTGNDVADSKIREAIESGLDQALAYRQNHNAERAAVCYYDMRRTNEGDAACFDDLADIAQEEKVPLWRWFLYRNMKDARRARGNLKPFPA